MITAEDRRATAKLIAKNDLWADWEAERDGKPHKASDVRRHIRKALALEIPLALIALALNKDEDAVVAMIR